MHYEGTLRIPADRGEVYAFITDPRRVVAIIPDVTESKVADADHFSLKAKAGVGPLRGTIDFAFSVAAKVEGRSADLTGRGKGMQSTIDLTLSMALGDAPEGCEAKWVADATVGGTLASIGGRLVGGIAERYVKQVTDNLAKAFS
jgi:uncharacterized protein